MGLLEAYMSAAYEDPSKEDLKSVANYIAESSRRAGSAIKESDVPMEFVEPLINLLASQGISNPRHIDLMMGQLMHESAALQKTIQDGWENLPFDETGFGRSQITGTDNLLAFAKYRGLPSDPKIVANLLQNDPKLDAEATVWYWNTGGGGNRSLFSMIDEYVEGGGDPILSASAGYNNGPSKALRPNPNNVNHLESRRSWTNAINSTGVGKLFSSIIKGMGDEFQNYGQEPQRADTLQTPIDMGRSVRLSDLMNSGPPIDNNRIGNIFRRWDQNKELQKNIAIIDSLNKAIDRQSLNRVGGMIARGEQLTPGADYTPDVSMGPFPDKQLMDLIQTAKNTEMQKRRSAVSYYSKDR